MSTGCDETPSVGNTKGKEVITQDPPITNASENSDVFISNEKPVPKKKRKYTKKDKTKVSDRETTLSIGPVTPNKQPLKMILYDGSSKKKSPDINVLCDDDRQRSLEKHASLQHYNPPPVVVFREIDPGQKKFHVKIRVMRLWAGHMDGKQKPFSIVFIARDSLGSHIEINVLSSEADIWKPLISLNKAYVLENVMRYISPAPTKVLHQVWQLSTTRDSFLHEIDADDISHAPLDLYSKLNRVSDFARRSEYLRDIIGYVVDISEILIVSLKSGGFSKLVEVSLIDDTHYRTPITLTLWEEFLKTTNNIFANGFERSFIILATGVKARDFKDSHILEATAFTSIDLIAAGVPRAQQLKNWVDTVLPVTVIPSPGAGSLRGSFVSLNELLKRTRIAPLESQSYVVSASVIYIFPDQPWYDSCAKCNKTVRLTSNNVYSCAGCGNTAADPKRSFRLRAKIEDGTDEVTIVLFDKQAQALLRQPFDRILVMYEEGRSDGDYEDHLSKCTCVSYRFRFVVNRQNHRYIASGGFTVADIERVLRHYGAPSDNLDNSDSSSSDPSMNIIVGGDDVDTNYIGTTSSIK